MEHEHRVRNFIKLPRHL